MLGLSKILKVKSFTFDSYVIDTKRSIVTFKYRVEFKNGIYQKFSDKLILKDVTPESWKSAPQSVLEPTLQALLIMIGINYWSAFPTKNIIIKDFKLTRKQADFWNSLYLNGLAEFFYLTKIDFRDLIEFPHDPSLKEAEPQRINLRNRALLLNGAGKDSILSAEKLKASNFLFDFFSFNPTPAHDNVAKLVGARSINVIRRRDPFLGLIFSGTYPSVSTFTFTAVLLAELLGYNSILFSNERSADFGNLTYLGLSVNHQWCKSTEAENLINDYIKNYITPDISTKSLLRPYSELEIVRQFISYPKYLYSVTSCNTYFWLPRIQQVLMKKNYWCKRCPKCVFIFACFSAFLPKEEVINIFGANLYKRRGLMKFYKSILGVEGSKPLDCVGEPEEMVTAMHYAVKRNEYNNEIAIRFFKEKFPDGYDFDTLEKKVFSSENS